MGHPPIGGLLWPPLLPLLDMVRVKVTLNGVGNGEMVALRIDPASDTMENVLSKAKAKLCPEEVGGAASDAPLSSGTMVLNREAIQLLDHNKQHVGAFMARMAARP